MRFPLLTLLLVLGITHLVQSLPAVVELLPRTNGRVATEHEFNEEDVFGENALYNTETDYFTMRPNKRYVVNVSSSVVVKSVTIILSNIEPRPLWFRHRTIRILGNSFVVAFDMPYQFEATAWVGITFIDGAATGRALVFEEDAPRSSGRLPANPGEGRLSLEGIRLD